MRYVELIETIEEDRLRDLVQHRAALMQQWLHVVQSDPPPSGSQANSDDPWWRDPKRGGIWNNQLRPLEREISELEHEVHRQEQRESEDDAGFNIKEVLYHGTNADFGAFDRSKGRTAQHIYTSPDFDTARDYGSHVYACYGRQRPQADLTVEVQNEQLLRKVHRRGSFKRRWGLSYRELAELAFEGQMYQWAHKSTLQDEVIGTCFDMGFKSVRITDPKHGGSFSDSVIFDDPADLRITKKLS